MLRVPFTRLSLLFDIIHPELRSFFEPVPWWCCIVCCIVHVSPLHSQEPQLKISTCSSWWHYKCLTKPTRTYQGPPGLARAGPVSSNLLLLSLELFTVRGSKASAGASGPIDPWRLEQHVEEKHENPEKVSSCL